MSRPKFRWPALWTVRHAVALALLISAGAMTAKEKTIVVDCANKGKINVALTDESPQLRIEFKGICAEDVLITRSNTTLIGVEAGARIVGAVVPPESRQPAVSVRDAGNVTLENFEIQDSDSRG